MKKKMSSRFIITNVFILVSLIFFIGISPNFAQLKKQSIVGTWKLVAYEDHLSDGKIEYPYGKNPAGWLIYDANGYMAIQIMRTPHPKVASDDDEKVTAEEKTRFLTVTQPISALMRLTGKKESLRIM